jgi:hypothetical protein
VAGANVMIEAADWTREAIHASTRPGGSAADKSSLPAMAMAPFATVFMAGQPMNVQCGAWCSGSSA